MASTARLCAPLLALCISCSPMTRSEGALDGQLTIIPAEVTLVASEATSAHFRAFIGETDVTTSATWTISDGSLGTIERGLFSLADGLAHGGDARVMAEYSGKRGSAALRVKLLAPPILGPGADEDAPAAFGGPQGGAAPQIVYPLKGAMLARNIAQMRIMWRGDAAQRLYRIDIESPTYKRAIYVGSRACAGADGSECGYRVSDEDWTSLANSVAGGQATLVISATGGPGQPVGRSPVVALSFSPEPVKGGLYYFSTSTYGLYRLPFGGTRALPFLLGNGDPNSINGCVGCHAVSQDGKKVAAVWAGGDGFAGIVDGTDARRYLLRPVAPMLGDPIPYPGQLWNFASFNPDGSRLITVWKGELALRSGDNGALLTRADPVRLGGRAAMPEWSPDGKSIVFVRVPKDGRLGYELARLDGMGRPAIDAGDWVLANSGDIAVVRYDDGAFGEVTTIVSSVPGEEYHFYPSFSPDSAWIVFNSVRKDRCFSPTASQNGLIDTAGRCMTYDQRGARLRLVRALPGSKPIELGAATHLADHTTSWPKFAPFQQKGGKLVFFTFSAKFDYGWEIKQALLRQSGGHERPQLWMSAIDLERAARGEGDPSYAPFWLPFQDKNTNNHEVIWTRDIACQTSAECGGEHFECAAGVCVPKVG